MKLKGERAINKPFLLSSCLPSSSSSLLIIPAVVKKQARFDQLETEFCGLFTWSSPQEEV